MTFVTRRLLVLVLAMALSAAACATMEVNSYVGPGGLVAPPRTYDWGFDEVQPTGDPRLDNNEFFEQRVRSAIDAQLARRGWRKTADAPSVLVHFHVSATEDLMFVGADTAAGPCTDCKAEIYDSGTLLVDIVSGRDERLVWRGWARDNVSGLVDNQKWLDAKVDQTVSRIFTKWPSSF